MASDHAPVVLHVVHSLQGGGTERTLVSLLEVFGSSPLRHVVVTLREAGVLAARLPDHVACRPVAAKGRAWFAGLTLAGITRNRGAAIIHARNTGCWFDAIVASRLAPRARLVLGYHGLEAGSRFTRRQRMIGRWGMRAGARFASVSLSGRRRLHAELGVPDHRIDILGNGVDLRRFKPPNPAARQAARHALHLDPSSFVVGTVGSLTAVKDHHTLIAAVAGAARSVKDVCLLIVGDGPLRGALGEQVRAEGIQDRVRLTGWREDVPQLLSAMDVYVCSSRSEEMSNAVLEAMATGIPIIATDVGDNAALVRPDIEGAIVDPGCAGDIEHAISACAQTPALCRQISTASRRRAERFALEEAVQAYEQWYESLLHGARPRLPSSE